MVPACFPGHGGLQEINFTFQLKAVHGLTTNRVHEVSFVVRNGTIWFVLDLMIYPLCFNPEGRVDCGEGILFGGDWMMRLRVLFCGTRRMVTRVALCREWQLEEVWCSEQEMP